MMQTNNPYNRVDDGIGAGVVGGAVIGGAAMAGFQYGAGRLSSSITNRPIRMGGGGSFGTKAKGYAGSQVRRAAARTGAMHNKFMAGSGKRKALTYGAAALGGALLGGIADSVND